MTRPIAQDTHYNGYRFRSRTEARWAVCFDAFGLFWSYEPQGYSTPYGRYLPDFYVHDPLDGQGVWVEVKGTDPSPEEHDKLAWLCKHTKRAGMLVSGRPEPGSGTPWRGFTPEGAVYAPKEWDVAWAWEFFPPETGWSMRNEVPPEGDELDAAWLSAVKTAQGTDFSEPWYSMFSELVYRDFTTKFWVLDSVPRTEQTLLTHYSDTRFLTRRHARWAVAFDAVGAAWSYIPDSGVSGGVNAAHFHVRAGDTSFWLRVFDLPPHAASDEMLALYHLCQTMGAAGGAVWGDPASPYTLTTSARWMSATSEGRNSGHVASHESMPWIKTSLDKGFYKSLSVHDVTRYWADAANAARSARFEHGEQPLLPAWSCVFDVPHPDFLGNVRISGG